MSFAKNVNCQIIGYKYVIKLNLVLHIYAHYQK